MAVYSARCAVLGQRSFEDGAGGSNLHLYLNYQSQGTVGHRHRQASDHAQASFSLQWIGGLLAIGQLLIIRRPLPPRRRRLELFGAADRPTSRSPCLDCSNAYNPKRPCTHLVSMFRLQMRDRVPLFGAWRGIWHGTWLARGTTRGLAGGVWHVLCGVCRIVSGVCVVWVFGTWCVACGVWHVVRGVRCAVCGVW